MTTFYPPFYYPLHDTPSDYDFNYGGEGDTGHSYAGAGLLEKSRSVQIVETNGHIVEITPGQRKVGGPPPGYDGLAPGSACEIFCGKIPRDIFEDQLIPLFEKFGTVWDFRLMMNPVSTKSRGYAFVKFVDPKQAKEAVRQMDNFEIRPGKNLTVTLCKPKVRLFVGNIPKIKGREELKAEFGRRTDGVVDVIVYNSPDDRKNNRGFCFIEYASHKHAYLAKKKLSTNPGKFWGCDIIVDWADPMEEPDEEVMSKVKVLYVRNLTSLVSQDRLRTLFERFGVVERVKKIKDYAFIHFESRENAARALEALDGALVCGTSIEITWAKPPTDKKKRETILRARERRTMQLMIQNPRRIEGYRMGMDGGFLGGMHPSMTSTGRGDFNSDWGHWGGPIFPEHEFYPYLPPFMTERPRVPMPPPPQMPFPNLTDRPQEVYEFRGGFRPPVPPRPTMVWTRRQPCSIFDLVQPPEGGRPRSPDDDNNWRANNGTKSSSAIPDNPISEVPECSGAGTQGSVNNLSGNEVPDTMNQTLASHSTPELGWRCRP